MRLGWGVVLELELEKVERLLVVLNEHEARTASEEEAGTAAEAVAKRGNTPRPEREGIIVRALCFPYYWIHALLDFVLPTAFFFVRLPLPAVLELQIANFDGQTEFQLIAHAIAHRRPPIAHTKQAAMYTCSYRTA